MNLPARELTKHIDFLVEVYGSFFQAAKRLNVTSKYLKRWYTGATVPSALHIDRIAKLVWLVKNDPTDIRKLDSDEPF